MEIPLEGLEATLADADRLTPIILRADKDIPLQLFVDVYEALKRLGFTTLSLQTEQQL
jgi:biopolymer transport protein ExbD